MRNKLRNIDNCPNKQEVKLEEKTLMELSKQASEASLSAAYEEASLPEQIRMANFNTNKH